MPKSLPIRPIFSKIRRKNTFDYWDDKTKKYVKCAGFELDIWDGDSETRIRRSVKADYQTAKIAYNRLLEIVSDANESLPQLLKRSRVRTIGELFAEYASSKSDTSKRNRQPRSPLTIKRVKWAVNNFQNAVDSDLALKSIKESTIERFIQARLDAGKQEGGINTDLRMLKSLFSWGVKHDHLDVNHFKKVDLFRVDIDEPRPLSPDELEQLFHKNPPGSRWYPLIMTYLLTGARLSEILKPKFSWKDIDFEAGTFRLPVRKGHKASEFPLDSTLIEIFSQLKEIPYKKDRRHIHPDDKDYPFPFTSWFISKTIKRLLNEAGIDGTTHNLRDSFVSHLIYLGYPIADVSKMAGHSTTKITEQYYYGQIEDRRREMINDLGQHLNVRVLRKVGTTKVIPTQNKEIDRLFGDDLNKNDEFFD